MASNLEKVDLSEYVQPVLASMVAQSAAAVPGVAAIATQFSNAVFQGSVNSLLTLRVAMVAIAYSSTLSKPRRSAIWRSATASTVATGGQATAATATSIGNVSTSTALAIGSAGSTAAEKIATTAKSTMKGLQRPEARVEDGAPDEPKGERRRPRAKRRAPRKEQT